jgi:long-chain acyl-CoA synthetase
MALVARDRAVERPHEIALRDDRVALTWGEVNEALNRVANALHAVDLGPARRVAVYAENSVETVLAHLGGLRLCRSTFI